MIAQHGFVALNNYAVVGTGSTPPAATQTGLANEVRRTIRDETGNTSGTRTITRVSDGAYEIRVVREFTEAEVGNTNLTEWGFSPVSTSGNNLMSRELFRDGNGNPVVITPASDQRLRLIYKILVSITPVTATAHSITIDGIGTRTGFVCVSRGGLCDGTADLTTVDNFARGNGAWPYPVRMALFSGASFVPEYTTYMSLHTGSSSVAAKNVSAFVPYTPGSRTRLIPAMTWGSNEANFTIRGAVLGVPCDPYIIPSFYVVFSDGQEFTKTNLYKLTIGEWTLTWGP
ncbi:hypothetical protein [Thermus caldilimi]|uniref:hypothetical protein n=1 Tax=Thermus caldilimi TaxID=2483360 RepID=UPI00197DD3F2|nr:hypothetical protein [Thermus caldilimi]